MSADLSSPEGIRRSFDDFFTGEVVEGPEIDGVATWQFEGQANPDGLAQLENPQDLLEGDLARLETLARAIQLTLVVGQVDQLPRRIELKLELSQAEREELGGFYAGDSRGGARTTSTPSSCCRCSVSRSCTTRRTTTGRSTPFSTTSFRSSNERGRP